MKVLFLRGFRGRETGEIHYVAGQVKDADVVGDYLLSLVERGIVEIITEDDDPADEEIQPPVIITKPKISRRVRRSK